MADEKKVHPAEPTQAEVSSFMLMLSKGVGVKCKAWGFSLEDTKKIIEDVVFDERIINTLLNEAVNAVIAVGKKRIKLNKDIKKNKHLNN